MAQFNPEPQPTRDPSYLGTSQGTDRASFQPIPEAPGTRTMSTPDYKADTTYGKLFEGVGDVLNTAVKGTDEAIKGHIKTDLYSQLDAIRDQFGVAKAQADPNQGKILGGAAGEGTPVPPAVNKLGNRVEGLTEAYKSGSLSDSYYWSKMEAEVRQIRAQYPGYRDYIDEKVSGILGTTPANALRRSLLQDVTELAKKQQSMADKWTTFEHTHAGEILASKPDYFQRKAAGNPYSQLDTEYGVAQVKADRQGVEAARAQLALLHAKKELGSDEAERALTSEMDKYVTQTLNSSMGQFGTQLASAKQKQASGQPLSAPERQQLEAGFQQFEAQIRNGFQQIQSTPWSPNDPASPSYRVIIKDPNKLKALEDQVFTRVNTLKTALFDGQYGLVDGAGRMNKAILDNDVNTAYRQNDVFRKWGALTQINPKLTEALMARPDTDLLGDTAFGLRQLNLSQILTGSETSMQGVVTRAQHDKVKNDPKYFDTAIRDFTQSITNKEGGDDQAVKSASALFNRYYNFLLKFEPSKQADYFARFSAPEVRQRMLELRDKGHNDLWNNYVSWAEDSSIAIVKGQIDTLQEGAVNRDIKLAFAPKTFQLSFEQKPAAYEKGSLADRALSRDYDTPLAAVNKSLSIMGGIYKAEGRNDPPKAIARLLKTTMDLSPQEGGGKFFLGAMIDAVGSWLKENELSPADRKKK